MIEVSLNNEIIKYNTEVGKPLSHTTTNNWEKIQRIKVHILEQKVERNLLTEEQVNEVIENDERKCYIML